MNQRDMARKRNHPASWARYFDPLRGEDWDWFCRRVLIELAEFESILEEGDRKIVAKAVGKTTAGTGRSILRAERYLADWIYRGKDRPLKLDLVVHKRRGKVIPTAAGRATLAFAQETHALAEKFLSKLYGLQNGGHIQVASINSAWKAYGRKLKTAFRNKVPDGQIALSFFSGDRYHERILAEVADGRVDVGITSYPPRAPDRSICVQPLADQEMVLVVPSACTIRPRSNPVRLSDVVRSDYDGINIVLYRKSLDAPGVAEIWRYLKTNDCLPQHRYQLIEIDNFLQAQQALESEPKAVSILPRLAVTGGAGIGGVRTYALDPPLEPWTWAVIYRVPITRPAVERFVECFDWLSKPPVAAVKRNRRRKPG